MIDHSDKVRLKNLAEDIKRQLNNTAAIFPDPDELLLKDAGRTFGHIGIRLGEIDVPLQLLLSTIDGLEVEE